MCGGDPFYSAKEVMEFVNILKQEIPYINMWSYTGFTYEEILNGKDLSMISLLKECDVIIDGMFVESKKDLTLPFRGSANQRIIDVKKSLRQGTIVKLME